MRKLILSMLIATMAISISCQKDNNADSIENAKKVTITANIVGDNTTRVSLTPETEDGKTTVKVAWKESGEKIKVLWLAPPYSSFTPTILTQISGTNQFTGDAVEDAMACVAGYGYDDNSDVFDYDISEQDGTLNERYVLMESDGVMLDTDEPITFNFHHTTAILKPKFTLNGESQNASISKIVLSGVSYACSQLTVENTGNKITITPNALEDIYIFLSHGTNFDGYSSGHTFDFVVTIGENEYTSTLTTPINIELGKFYTATLPLQ